MFTVLLKPNTRKVCSGMNSVKTSVGLFVIIPVQLPKKNMICLSMNLLWHTKSTLVINFSPLKMPYNAVFWGVLPTSARA